MKYKLILLMVILIVIPIAYADIISMGRKHVNYCVEISNIADYPDYVFAYYGELIGGFDIISADECFSFYKFDRPRIYAFEEDAFEEFKEFVNYKEYSFDRLLAGEYFENLPSGVHASDIEFRTYGLVSQYDPLKSIEDVVEIKSISNGLLDIDKKEIVFGYENGKTAVKQYTSDETPSAPKKLFLPFSLWMLLIPIISGLIILIILMRRKK